MNGRRIAGADRGAREIPGGAGACAAAGDFQLAPAAASAAAPVRVTNKQLPVTPGAYVLADGGGERFGGNTFLARNANTTGQFLFIITEGGPGGGVGAHFHARHFENFFGLDGETLGWAYGKAVPLRMGDYFQAPPRNLHGFRLNQAYNRFAAFLTPGIFENFFIMMGGRGRGPGGRARRRLGRTRWQRRRSRPRGVCRRGADMFRTLQMSGRGPDGYPLDVHGPTLPLPPQDPVWIKGRRRRLRIERRCSRTRRRSAGSRSAARSRRSCVARWRSSRGRRISFDRRSRRCHGVRARRIARRGIPLSRATGAAEPPTMRTLTYASRDGTDLLLDSVSACPADSPPDPGDRVSARRRMVRRHADDGSGLQALLRAGRVRDGVDRIPADSRRSRFPPTWRTCGRPSAG